MGGGERKGGANKSGGANESREGGEAEMEVGRSGVGRMYLYI